MSIEREERGRLKVIPYVRVCVSVECSVVMNVSSIVFNISVCVNGNSFMDPRES